MAGTSDGDGGRFGGVATMVGWIGAGALLVAAGALAVEATLTLPFSRALLVGLGIALGGGIGAVGYLLSADDIEETEPDRETMTVEMDEEAIPAPEPVDLFDGHPDPILYYADGGYGPVVRAANESFGATFDVPPGRIAGTPLEETLMTTDSDAVDTESITDPAFETTVECKTGSGVGRFRLRSVDAGGDGYLLYTPVE
jgi:hypothetical protein